MKLFGYSEFVNSGKLNENLDKARKFLKEREILRKAADQLGFVQGELAAQLKHGEKKSLTLKDFTEDQVKELRMKMREIKISDEELKSLERDSDFIKLREILKDNLGYLYNFTYLHYVEMVPLDEIQSLYKEILSYRDILDKLPKKFDDNFIDTNISNNSEVLVDGLEDLRDYRNIKKVIDQLTPDLKKAYNSSPELVKDDFADVARSFNNISEDPKKKERLWKSFFGELKEVDGKLRYFGPLKRYGSDIKEFLKAAKNFLKSSQNDSIIEFYEKIDNCNIRFGNLGADIVFDENGILVIEVKSFAANQLLNGHTRHCIKDSNSQWESYVTNTNGKQYYIYNFNLEPFDNLSTIGITIVPSSSKVYACHLKDDTGYSGSIVSKLKEWQKSYDIKTDIFKDVLVPISEEEKERRERAKIANREIVRRGITAQEIEKLVKVDGADINKDSCKALLHAVDENDHEKARVILELGGNPRLLSSSSIIGRSKDLEMIKVLIQYGADMSDDIMANVMNNPVSLEFCLKAGLNPSAGNNIAIRKACRGTFVSSNNVGESLLETFKLLMDYNADIKQNGKNMLIRWTGEFGRIDCIEYAKAKGKLDDMTKEDVLESLDYLDRTRRIPDKHREDFKNAVLRLFKLG